MSSEKDLPGVPLLDLNAQYDSIKTEIKEAVDRVLESQYFIMGPEVSAFEEDVAAYCGADYAIGCASGSDALLLSLMALDVGPGDAVITTPYTFFATAGAISRLGAVPIFIDIDPVSYNMDPEKLRDFLEGSHPLRHKFNLEELNLKAVIPVHLYGQMADMDPIMELAREHGLYVIEDAAQAIGAEYKGRRAGSIGDLGCFSFFPSKNLGAYGDGGLVTAGDPELAEKLRVLRLHGAKPKYHHTMVGINSRLDAIQAAILKVKLRYLDRWSDDSRAKALAYNRMIEEAGIAGDWGELSCMGGCGDMGQGSCSLKEKQGLVYCPQETEGDPAKEGRHVYHQYVIRTGARQEIMDAFDEKNIGYSVYYPVPLHEQQCFRYLGYEADDCPVSTCASNTTLALPIYPEITAKQQAFVVEAIKEAILPLSH